jgi:hypothetical protein
MSKPVKSEAGILRDVPNISQSAWHFAPFAPLFLLVAYFVIVHMRAAGDVGPTVKEVAADGLGLDDRCSVAVRHAQRRLISGYLRKAINLLNPAHMNKVLRA